MPGWEAVPNLTASEVLAYGHNWVGQRPISIGQFPTDLRLQKVQNFFDASDKTNISIRFFDPQFPEPA